MNESLRLVRKKVISIKVQLPCEHEGCAGFMESSSGMVLTSNPPQYPHRCNICGVERHITGHTFPYMEFK